ncbi:MAG TPA: nuclear transport factor 2 family protein [Candidatus Dormibacteraeota bacterium]|nr:nuclear transport factor 2 family protein [Candidatus Dormibacteraeota bacterium]
MAKGRTTEVVRAYYDSWTGGIDTFDEARLRGLLAPDLHFEGPIAGKRTEAEPFLRGLANFVGVMRGIRMLHQVYDEDEAAVLYDAELPGGMVRFAEFFRVEGDRIRSLVLHYDAGEYRARGGR